LLRCLSIQDAARGAQRHEADFDAHARHHQARSAAHGFAPPAKQGHHYGDGLQGIHGAADGYARSVVVQLCRQGGQQQGRRCQQQNPARRFLIEAQHRCEKQRQGQGDQRIARKNGEAIVNLAAQCQQQVTGCMHGQGSRPQLQSLAPHTPAHHHHHARHRQTSAAFCCVIWSRW
jgi:hypothetical protein